MGTWGIDSFENDDASDWSFELAAGGVPYVRSTLRDADVPATVYLDADLACMALAAADTVARLRGAVGQSDAYTEEVDAWVASVSEGPDPELVALSIRVLDRVIGEGSELRELWAESDSEDEWLASVASLRQRLGGS